MHLKSEFKRTINSNKYQPVSTVQAQNQYLNYLINLSFKGISRLFVLSFENDTGRAGHAGYYLLTGKIKNYKVTINGQSLFDHPVKGNLRTYERIQKTTNGNGNDSTIDCLFGYTYFKENYKLIVKTLTKRQDTGPKAIQWISFTGNLEHAGNETMFFIIKEAKEAILNL